MVWDRQPSEIKHPKIKVTDDTLFHAIRLAKAGYYGGSPENVKRAPLDTVLNIIVYENFDADLKTAYKDLNK